MPQPRASMPKKTGPMGPEWYVRRGVERTAVFGSRTSLGMTMCCGWETERLLVLDGGDAAE